MGHMGITAGSRLGTHEILGLLGAGGMGEVYRALDTRLNRQVAIKVLPDAYAADPERVARFHREAQAVAALNHPNIAAIYDLSEADGVKFLILELIEGDTLADRIRRGPIPIDDALAIARQILEALEAAHEKGICHRDLKPANIKLTSEGAVKVLDFGLAKFLETSPQLANLTHSPTLSVAGTYPGVIMGTAGYMSPEQAKGFQADHRSDLVSFGCVLYELLTGRQAFDGETASEILAGVLKSEVDLTTLPPRLNPRLTELLRRCLEKNPKKRWHAAADVRVEIEAVSARPLVVDEPRAAHAAARPWWRRALPAVVTALIVGPSVGYLAWTLKPQPASAVMRFAIPLPEGQNFTVPSRPVLTLSPEGTNLVYLANSRLYLRALSGLEAHAIAGSEGQGISTPVFSPDGQSVAYFSPSDLTLKRLAIGGGAAVTVCAAELPLGMSWDENGIVFGQPGKGILRVSAKGGTAEVIAQAGGEEVLSNPQMLPGGRAVLFSSKKVSDGWDKGSVVVQSLSDGARTTLVEGGSHGHYLSTGHLLYAVAGVLLAAPYSLGSLSISGAAVPVLEGVSRGNLGSTGNAHFAVASNGVVAYVPGPTTGGSSSGVQDLALIDRKGSLQPLKLPPDTYRSPRVSPDGKFVAFEKDDAGEAAVWIYQIAGGTALRRLTFGGRNRHPIWSSDGRWVAFQSNREGDLAIFRQRADGSGTAERLTRLEGGAEAVPQSFSRDGAHLLFSALKGNQWTLWTMTMKDRTPSAFGGVVSIDLVEGAFSPDGRWVAYQVHEPTVRVRQIFLQPFPATGAKYLVRAGGHPYWSPKGDQLILNVGAGTSVIIPVVTMPAVAFGQPIEFPRQGRTEGDPATIRRNVDSMPDGQHIIGVTNGGSDAARTAQINIVLNWFEEVRQKIPKQ